MARAGGSVHKNCYICIWCWPWIHCKSTREVLWSKVGCGQKHGQTVACMEIYEDNGTHKVHWNSSFSLTSFSVTVLGDLQEKWMSFAIMLQAYLVKDKDNMSKRSGGRSSYESTINWTTWSAATLWVAIVPGALHQPVEHRNMATTWQVPSKSYADLFHGQP